MENKIELGVVPEKEYINTPKIVPDAAIARRLLKDGYRIVDIKPKRGYPHESIFVFEATNGFMEKMQEYIRERKERFEKKES